MDVIWKNINGYEGLYQVSNTGLIRSFPRRRTRGGIRKLNYNKGYAVITLHKNGKMRTFQVHRLVAAAFIDNPENKPEINHLDEDKLNNRVENLQWATSKENANWGTRNNRISEYVKKNPIPMPYGQKRGRRKKEVIQLDPITKEIVSRHESTIAASNSVGCSNANISECCNGKRKTAKGYLWRFAS